VSIQIIETLGGRMELNSRSGEETKVSILLPVSEQEAKQPFDRQAQDKRTGGSEGQ